MKIDLKNMPCFGVAGNFTGHLEQAGEAVDFKNIKAAEGAPKAMFPTFIPGNDDRVPQYLHVFPFDSKKIIFPENEEKLQIEPECAIICNVLWKDGKVVSLEPKFFGASNDCSIRKEGAKKISMKKNWGLSSKGLSDNLIPVDKFDENGILQNYKIASFLIRNGKVYQYGEDSAVRDYSYIYKQLLDWSIDKLNNQQEEGPAEKISVYLEAAKYPSEMMISIGATRYTDFGQHNFLENGDLSVVVVYPMEKYSLDEIKEIVSKGDFKNSEISVLCQKVEI